MNEDKKVIKKPNILKALLVSLLILLMLVAARFINLTIWWNMTKLELQSNSALPMKNYNFLGFSGYKSAKEQLINLANRQIREVSIVSYYDFFHSAVFLLHSRSTNPLVNLGIMNVLPGKGFIDCFFLPSEIMKMRTNKDGIITDQAVYYGASPFPVLYGNLAGHISGEGTRIGEGTGKKPQPISFILSSNEKANYFKIPYYIYFYLPLLLILILISFYGKPFCLAFCYYLGLFLLFDYKKVFFTLPFSWLIDILGKNFSSSETALIPGGFVILFSIVSLIGLFSFINKKRRLQLTTWGKGLIFFFILLPLFVRF